MPNNSGKDESGFSEVQKAASFVEEAAKKVQDSYENKYDFNWKSPSSQIGGESANHGNGEAENTRKHTQVVNDREGSKVQSDSNSGSKAGTTVPFGGEDSKINTSSTVRVNDTNKTLGTHGGNKINVDDRKAGYYSSRRKLDMTDMANAVATTVKSQYQDAQSVQGYQEMKHISTLAGVGTISRRNDKATLVNTLYYRGDETKTKLNEIFGNDYAIGSHRSNNVIADYHKNVQTVENYLTKYNIHSQNMKASEIKKALDSGKIGTVSIEKNSDLETALKELFRLRGQGDTVKHYTKSGGGLKKVSSAWIKEAMGDTDVAQGYSVYKTSKQVTKAGIKLGSVGLKSAANLGISGVSGVRKGIATGQQAYSKIRIRTSKDADTVAKYTTKLSDLRTKKINISANSRSTKASVRKFNPIKNTKVRIKGAISGVWNRTPWMKGIHGLKAKFNNLKIVKIFKMPGIGINKIKTKIASFLGKLMAALGGILVATMIIMIIGLAIVGKMGSGTSISSDDDASQTNAQVTVNYLYSLQSAYANNIYNCNSEDVCIDGTKMISKRLPNSWFSQMRSADPWIDENDAAVYWEGSIAGFDLSRYWGEMSSAADELTLEIPGYDSFNNQAIYTDSVAILSQEPCDHPVYEEDDDGNLVLIGYMKYIGIDFCGYAGFQGDAGSKDVSLDDYVCGTTLYYNYALSDASGTDYEIEFSDGESMMDRWRARDNEDIYVNYYYRGSEYSCHVTSASLVQSIFSYMNEGGAWIEEEIPGKFHYEKESEYMNTNGETVTYNVDEFYKAILTVAAGMTDNSDSFDEAELNDADDESDDGGTSSDGDNSSDTEKIDFFKKYCKKFFDKIMDDATIELVYKYIDVSDDDVEWTINDTSTGGVFKCSDNGMLCVVNLNIYLNFCGVSDMILEDTKVTNDESGDTWVHTNDSTGKFYNNDKTDAGYILWWSEDTDPSDYIDNELETDNIYEEGILIHKQTWGQTTKEVDEDKVVNSVYPSSDCNDAHYYTTVMANTIDMDNFTVEDWQTSVYGLLFPSEIKIANFTKKGQKIVDSMNGLISMDTDWESVKSGEFTTGDASLDEFMQYATTQGWIENATGQEGLCYFTSLMMVAMYYHSTDEDLEYIKEHLTDYAKKWCAADGTVLNANGDWGSEFDLSIGGDTSFSTFNEMTTSITSELDSGNPVMLHIKGEWSGSTGTYHTGDSQHFLVIYSADNEGVEVADPAGTATGKKIPWSSLYEQIGSTGNGFGVRYIGTTSEG